MVLNNKMISSIQNPSQQKRTLNFEKYLLLFTIVDILFAPYVFFLATTYSQFIVFIWFIMKDKQFFYKREVKLYYWILAFILLSVFISMFVVPSNQLSFYVIENLKRGLNIGLAVSYYFFFYYMFKEANIRIEKWLFVFVVFVTVWGVLYYMNINLFLSLKVLFNPRDATMTNLVLGNFFLRFNYIWTDPNNVGYTLVAVVSFLIINKGVNNIQLIISVLCLLFCLLLIMSAGSIASAVVFIPLAYIIRLRNSRSFVNFVMIAVSLVVIGYIVQKYYSDFASSEIGERATLRLENKNESGDTRPLIWKELFESKNLLLYLFAGEGTILFVNGQPYSPHSGHWVFIFGYGMIAYFFYLYIIFRKPRWQKWKYYIYILPFFLCFTINIGIGELKFAAIMYMMVAFSRIDGPIYIKQ